jgi:hypothetical protein
MAKIQISFQDNSDNEDEFRVYRGTATPVTTSDTLIATLSHDGTNWSIAGVGSNLEISQGANNDPATSGDTYVVLYDETTAGDYYYGVLASNAVGDSAVSTSGLVTVTS